MAASSPCLTQAHPNSSLGFFSSWHKSQDLAVLLVQRLRHTDLLSVQIFNHPNRTAIWGRGGCLVCFCSSSFFFGATVHLLSADFICETNGQFCGCWSPRANSDFEVGSDFTQPPWKRELLSTPCTEQRDCGFSLLLQGREPWTGSFPSRTWNSSLLPASLEKSRLWF